MASLRIHPIVTDLGILPLKLTKPTRPIGAAVRTRFPSPDSPRDALELPDVAWYFYNYIAEPAKWYDLCDALRQFATKVPELALDEPLLFSAVIALSAVHVSQTTGSKTARETAEFYHGQCVRRLIQLDGKSELLRNGVALATACLLRSYEILDGEPLRELFKPMRRDFQDKADVDQRTLILIDTFRVLIHWHHVKTL